MQCCPCIASLAFPFMAFYTQKSTFTFCGTVVILLALGNFWKSFFPPIVPLEVVFKTKPTLSTYEDNEVCQVSSIKSVFESLAIKYTRFPQEEMYIPLSFNNSCNLYLQSSSWKVWVRIVCKRVSIKAIKI